MRCDDTRVKKSPGSLRSSHAGRPPWLGGTGLVAGLDVTLAGPVAGLAVILAGPVAGLAVILAGECRPVLLILVLARNTATGCIHLFVAKLVLVVDAALFIARGETPPP